MIEDTRTFTGWSVFGSNQPVLIINCIDHDMTEEAITMKYSSGNKVT